MDLFELGVWTIQHQKLTQEMIDKKLGDIIVNLAIDNYPYNHQKRRRI